MKAKPGDIIEFLAISWNEENWEFDHPTVVMKPVIRYSPNGEGPETMIEDMAIDLSCGDDLEDEDVSRRGWSLKRLRRVARERLDGKDTWKTKARKVVKQKIEFYLDENQELQFKVLETQER